MAHKPIHHLPADGSTRNNYESDLDPANPQAYVPVATLTLRLRVHLNFVSSHSKFLGPVIKVHGKLYAQDGNGWLFPIVDWNNRTIGKFQKRFLNHATHVWNRRFVATTHVTPLGGFGFVVGTKDGEEAFRVFLDLHLADAANLTERVRRLWPANCHFHQGPIRKDDVGRHLVFAGDLRAKCAQPVEHRSVGIGERNVRLFLG